MRYVLLACDYDGTIATNGVVAGPTLAALGRVRRSGRRLVLVTGRRLEDLLAIGAPVEAFDRVVAENGAVLYDPETREVRTLGIAPPPSFVSRLVASGVTPLAVGHVIVATTEPHETAVVEAIRDSGLELHVVFNKGAVMVLPAGINKASGLSAALAELQASCHGTVGIGDAENDQAFVSLSECGVAVADALPALKARVDHVTTGSNGTGVAELCDRVVADDLRGLPRPPSRHRIVLGTDCDGREVALEPAGEVVLLAGPSGSGKSTLATGLLERVTDAGYQLCIVDPEGDYETFADALVVGEPGREPAVDELLHVLQSPTRHVVANLLGVPLDERPAFLRRLLPRLEELVAVTGRPHWLVIDEAHHLLASEDATAAPPTIGASQTMLVTVHPDRLVRAVLATVTVAVVTGPDPGSVLAHVGEAVGCTVPSDPGRAGEGEATWWDVRRGDYRRFRPTAPRAERRRHRRKYAEGELAEDRSFYFTGPTGALRLRAQNLRLFLQTAEGVDDATWMHHLRRGEYSGWFRDAIKDGELAADAAAVESSPGISPAESRRRIRAAIEARYTRPA